MNEQKLLTTNLPETDTLTPMQRIFVAEYLATWNATKAARAAGYSCVRASANDCMQNPVIRKAIDEELSAYEVGAKHVLAVLSEQARLNVNDFLDDDGRSRRAEGNQKHGQLVKKYRYKLRKTEENGDQIFDVELELIDSQAALFFLGKHNRAVNGRRRRRRHARPDDHQPRIPDGRAGTAQGTGWTVVEVSRAGGEDEDGEGVNGLEIRGMLA